MSKKPADVPLEDPLHVREIYADELAWTGIDERCIRVTLAIRRADLTPEGEGAVTESREVAARLVLPFRTVNALMAGFTNLSQLAALAKHPNPTSGTGNKH